MIEEPPPPQLIAARRAAGLLLALMAAIYVAAFALQESRPAFGYVRAFAEAALVGGLADWFAVTALFRRPLGLPIPHTAVIPANKNRIAESLGQFIVSNFLQPDLVRRRLEAVDLAAGLARQLCDPAAARRIAEGIVASVPPLLELLDDQRMAALLAQAAKEQAAHTRAAPLLGEALAVLSAEGRHQGLIDLGIGEAARALAAEEPAFRARVSGRTGWFSKLFGLDAKAADALIGAMRETLAAIAADPAHPARGQITARIAEWALLLKTSPSVQAEVEAIKTELITHPAVGRYLQDLWGSAKAAILSASAEPGGPAVSGLARTLTGAGEALLQDADARAAINARLSAFIAELAGRYGGEIAALVSDTIRGWDTATVTMKLEHSLGRDLQFIRINGTLVGGLVGLAIHAASQAASALMP